MVHRKMAPRKNKNTLIISAFPGSGKSYMTKFSKQYKCIDSDSSLYSWIYKDGVKTDERNPDFPNNYMAHIKANIGKCDIIFVSTHESVRNALLESGLNFTIVYPMLKLKNDFMNRYELRGSDEKFIQLMDKNFEKFVKELDKFTSDHVTTKDDKRTIAAWLLSERHPYIDDEMINQLIYIIGEDRIYNKKEEPKKSVTKPKSVKLFNRDNTGHQIVCQISKDSIDQVFVSKVDENADAITSLEKEVSKMKKYQKRSKWLARTRYRRK